MVDEFEMSRTQPGHIRGGVENSLSDAHLKYRIPHQPSVDGNTVDTDIEKAEFSKNVLQFQASLRFLSGRFSGLLLAIKGE